MSKKSANNFSQEMVKMMILIKKQSYADHKYKKDDDFFLSQKVGFVYK